MRLTVFWERMNARFGPAYAESVARDFTVAQLEGRTAHEALASGVPAKQVWLAICDAFEIPPKDR